MTNEEPNERADPGEHSELMNATSDNQGRINSRLKVKIFVKIAKLKKSFETAWRNFKETYLVMTGQILSKIYENFQRTVENVYEGN